MSRFGRRFPMHAGLAMTRARAPLAAAGALTSRGITDNGITQGGTPVGVNSGAASLTITVPAVTNGYLLCCIANANKARSVTSATLAGGQAFTLLKRYAGVNAGFACEIWGLANPNVGTLGTALTWDGATPGFSGMMLMLTDAHQTVQNGSSGGTDSSSAAPVVGPNLTVGAGQLQVAVLADNDASSVTVGTKRVDDGSGDGIATLASSGAITWAGSNGFVIGAAAIMPAAGAAVSDTVTRVPLRGVTSTGVSQVDTLYRRVHYDLANSFSTGGNNGVITTGNSGGLPGNDAFDLVNGSPTYDNVHSNSGGQSARFPTTAGAGQVGWSTKIKPGAVHYGRAYFYINAANGALTRIVTVAGDVLGALATISVTTANKLSLVLAGDAPIVSSSVFTIGAWARLEWWVEINSDGNAQAFVRWWASKDSTGAPTEEVSDAVGVADRTIVQSMVGVSSSATATVWVDDFEVSDVGWIGPFSGVQVWEADVADQGSTITDTLALTRILSRGVTDTGEAQTDTIAKAVVKVISSTGVTQTDSVSASKAAVITRSPTDTGVSQSDSIGKQVAKGVADTGVTQTDSAVRLLGRARPVTDTGSSISDSLARLITRGVSDTGAAVSDGIGQTYPRGITDDGIGYTFLDQFGRSVSAGAWGNGWTITPSSTLFSVDGSEGVVGPFVSGAAVIRNALQPATADRVRARMQFDVLPVGNTRNHGLLIRCDSSVQNAYRLRLAVQAGGTVNLTLSKLVANAGTTIYNSLASSQPTTGQWWWIELAYLNGQVLGRLWKDGNSVPVGWEAAVTDSDVADGGNVGVTMQMIASQTDTPTFLWDDFGYRMLDTVGRTVVHGAVGVTDTGLTQSDSATGSRSFSRTVTDTGETAGDSISTAVSRPRTITDSGASISDSVASRGVRRGLTDTGAAVTDSLATTRIRPIIDTGTTVTDTVTTPRSRAVTDTGESQADTLATTRVRAVTSTGATVTDTVTLGGARVRAITDTGLVQTDTLVKTAKKIIADTGESQTDTVLSAAARGRVVTDTGTVIHDWLGNPTWKLLGRINHGGVNQPNGFTNAQDGQLYGVFVCNYIDRASVAALKSLNPSLQVYCYFDPIATDSNDTGGQASGVDYAVANNGSHNNWFLLDASSARIAHDSQPTTWMMDIGLQSYQDGVVSHVLTMMQDGTPWDGVFLDEIGANTGYCGFTTPPPSYPTPTTWQAALNSFFARVCPQFHAAGLRVMPNISDDFDTSDISVSAGIITQCDGYFEESWTDGGAGLSQQNAWTPYRILVLQDTVSKGKVALLHSHSGTEAGQTYAIATQLCFGDINSFQDTAQPDYRSEYLPTEYTTALGLGYPTGAATVLASGGSGGTSVYRRNFTKGIVLSNTQPVSFGPYSLGGTFTGSGFTNISSVTLAAHSGVVMLSVGAVTRTVSDSGTTFSDALTKTAAKPVTDTGLTQTDSVARSRVTTRGITDTGTSQTDTVARKAQRPLTDTGTTITDSLGRTTPRAVTDYGIGGIVAAADAFARTVTAGQSTSWGTADTGQAWTVLSSAAGSTYGVASGATNQTAAANTGRRGQSLAGLPGSNMTAAARFSLDVTPTGAAFFCAVLVRMLDGANYYTGDVQVSTAGNLSYRIRKVLAAATTNIFAATASGLNVSPGGRFWIRAQAQDQTISVRIWLDGQPEPMTWSAQVQDPDIPIGTGVGLGGVGQATVTNSITETITSFQTVILGSDQVGRTVAPILTDTGASVTDAVSRSMVAARPITDTGEAQTDSVNVAAGGHINVSDTGTTMSDSISRLAPFSRAVTDTGLAQSDSVTRAISRIRTPTETGASIFDSVGRMAVLARQVADTGATITDSAGRTATRTVASVGATITDTVSIPRSSVRSPTDTGASITDSVAPSAGRTRAVTDTGATVTDLPGRLVTRRVIDTGDSQTDTIAPSHAVTRPLTDSGVISFADSVSRTITRARGVTDTLTMADSITATRLFKRAIIDAGESQNDTVATTSGGHITITDTGLSQTDSVTRTAGRLRPVTDTGVTASDAVTVTRLRQIGVSDTGDAQSDTLGGRRIVRTVTDTGASVSDLPGRAIRRGITDAGSAVSDAVTAARGQPLTDRGVTMSDSVARLKTALRPLTDQGAAITDSVRRVALTGVTSIGTSITDAVTRSLVTMRPLTDVGVTIFDQISTQSAGKVGVSDSMLQSDHVTTTRYRLRLILDTGLAQTDVITILSALTVRLVDQGATIIDVVRIARRVITGVSGPTTQPRIGDGTTEVDVAGPTTELDVGGMILATGPRGPTSQPIVYAHTEA